MNLATNFMEAHTPAAFTRKQDTLQPLEKRMARRVAVWFMEQLKTLKKTLRPLRPQFNQAAMLAKMSEQRVRITMGRPLVEALTPNVVSPLIDAVLADGEPELKEIIETFAITAIVDGAQEVLLQFNAGVSFGLDNPRALAWVGQRSDKAITEITETTRRRVNNLVFEAIDEGWSWQRLAENLDILYEEKFAGRPLFPSKLFRSRSEAIAVFEMGDAFEQGNQFAAQELLGLGIELEKRWISARDSKVRPAHRANDEAGWLDMSADFPSGDTRPPTDPGCRCTLGYRRKRDN